MLPSFFTRSRGLGKLYSRMFAPLLEEWGLTQTEADILLFLANNPEYDTAKDMVEKRHLAKSHISVGIDALVSRGLLERFWREGNRKTIHLRLTPQADPVIQAGRTLQARYGSILFAGFTQEEKETLVNLLDRVVSSVDQALEKDGRYSGGA